MSSRTDSNFPDTNAGASVPDDNYVYAIDQGTCVECGCCRRYCPVEGAVIIDQTYQHVIVPDRCIGCGICEAFCPVPETIFKIPYATAQALERLRATRRAVWRGKWHYSDHPVMGPLTKEAARQIRPPQDVG